MSSCPVQRRATESKAGLESSIHTAYSLLRIPCELDSGLRNLQLISAAQEAGGECVPLSYVATQLPHFIVTWRGQ
jgi:hypothetical protein